MGKGILAVGFPDTSRTQSEWGQSVKDDQKKLRHLIYLCDERVIIPKSLSSSQESNSDLACQNGQLEQEQDGNNQPQSRSHCCSIM